MFRNYCIEELSITILLVVFKGYKFGLCLDYQIKMQLLSLFKDSTKWHLPYKGTKVLVIFHTPKELFVVSSRYLPELPQISSPFGQSA